MGSTGLADRVTLGFVVVSMSLPFSTNERPCLMRAGLVEGVVVSVRARVGVIPANDSVRQWCGLIGLQL